MPSQIADYAHDTWAALLEHYAAVRRFTEELAARLSPEDQCVQSMPDASPAKWHLGHTAWFFETFILERFDASYKPVDRGYSFLFNSYYDALGPRHSRAERGLITRPSVAEVIIYRRHVDEAIADLFQTANDAARSSIATLIDLGLNHEQQHQELILSDIKHAFFRNPMLPCYAPPAIAAVHPVAPVRWIDFRGGAVSIGHDGDAFAYDNERPRHEVLLAPYRLASRPVTCGEYLGFIEERGYDRPRLWLSDGWATARAQGWGRRSIGSRMTKASGEYLRSTASRSSIRTSPSPMSAFMRPRHMRSGRVKGSPRSLSGKPPPPRRRSPGIFLIRPAPIRREASMSPA